MHMAAHEEQDSYEVALRAKISAWQAALDAYLAAKAADGGTFTVQGKPNNGGGPSRPSRGYELPVGALRGHTLPEAIKIYLEAGNRKQTNKEIALGVKAAGLETNQANLEAGVASALFRMRQAGVVLRFEDGWDLAAHYPEHIRKNLQSDNRPRKSKTKARKPKNAPQQADESV
jgi:hypothetical protein